MVEPMAAKTSIQWSDATWSPLRVRVRNDAADIARAKNYTSLIQISEKMAGRVGQHCEHVSDGCLKCYSGTWQGRCLTSGGTGLPFDRRSRDLVEPFVDEKTLSDPLRWKTPKKIFVENQSDLFGEWYADEMIDRVFAVMALADHHTYQVLTKRVDRMLSYFMAGMSHFDPRRRIQDVLDGMGHRGVADALIDRWPLPNVWIGVSVEDQKTAASRVDILRQVPASLRFISQEPQISHIDWTPNMLHGVSWLIVGGESGPGARPFDVQWARDTVAQCQRSGTACFVKQLGGKPFVRNRSDYPAWPGNPTFTIMTMNEPQVYPRQVVGLKDRKGGDMSEWPVDLRVRQFPGEQPIVPAADKRSDEFHDPEPEC